MANRTVFLYRMEPVSQPKHLATPSWHNLKYNRVTFACHLLTLSTRIVRKSTRPTNHIAVPPSHSCCCMCADVWGEISSLLNRPAPTKLKLCRLHTLVCIDNHPARNQAEEGEVGHRVPQGVGMVPTHYAPS